MNDDFAPTVDYFIPAAAWLQFDFIGKAPRWLKPLAYAAGALIITGLFIAYLVAGTVRTIWRLIRRA